MSRLNLGVVLGLAALLGVVGCSGAVTDADRPATVPCTATVTYNGTAVDGAVVTFAPKDTAGKAAFGRTDSSGKATLTTYHDDPGAGAVPGEYDVTVSKVKAESTASEDYDTAAAEADAGTVTVKTTDLVPARYKNAATSKLSANVTDGGENSFTFELTD